MVPRDGCTGLLAAPGIGCGVGGRLCMTRCDRKFKRGNYAIQDTAFAKNEARVYAVLGRSVMKGFDEEVVFQSNQSVSGTGCYGLNHPTIRQEGS